jgi:hypothetical protein
MMNIVARSLLLLSLSSALVPAAQAADLPMLETPPPADVVTSLAAVSALNGKIEILGGYLTADDEEAGAYGAAGSLSIPLGHRFGFQADGLVASVGGEAAYGAAGHLFWRDPSIALVGVYAGYTRLDAFDANIAHLGVEGEAYLGRFSVEALAGFEHIDLPAAIGDEEQAFASLDLALYATDNLRFSLGYRYGAERSAAALGAEVLLPVNTFGAPSLFAEGRIGEDDYASVMAGVRFYFGGGDKSLIRRHREDDPRNRLPETVTAFGEEACIEPEIIYYGRESEEGPGLCSYPEEPYYPD